ncbi:MAG: rhomboid family intramembrane serine protease [Chryseolinea sp.]
MAKKLYSTYILLGINFLVFALLSLQQQSLMFNTNADVLAILDAGGNLNPMTMGGQPWRIITSMFLHYGIIHLVVNMYALYSMGVVLEPAIGTVRFTLVYYFCGITSGFASLALNVYVISAGASGALFGLYGYRLGAELVSSFKNPQQLKIVFFNFVFFVVANAVLTGVFNVDLWGHLGGLIAGFALAIGQFRFRLLLKNYMLALAFVPLCLLYFLLPLDQLRYYNIFQRVLVNERKTNQVYDSPLNDGQLRDSLVNIKSEWDSILYSFTGLKRVLEILRGDTSAMKQYIKLHRKETDYRLALIEKESYVYIDSLEVVNTKFDSIPSFKYHLNYHPVLPVENEEDTASSSSALKSKRLFFDVHWKETNDPSGATFYRVGQTDSAGRWQGAVRDYFRNGVVQMKGTYKDNMKSGIFIYYSDHGTYSSAGRYDKEQSIGKWETYYWNGKLKEEIYYDNRTFVRNVFDSLGRPQVVNGNGKVTDWYSNGQIAQTGSYKDGRKDGDWYGYHPDGTAYFKEAYHDNKLLKGVSFDKDGRRYVYDELSFYAYPVNGMGAFKTYVERNIIRPTLQNGGGSVKVLFNVGFSGDMWDFVIMKGISPECDAEAIRLIKEGPPWRSGLLHGHVPQPSQGYAEIEF